ncbi:MAG: hypothetical protein V3W34_18020 [Phycisphaerae bacterium]
MMNTWRLLAQSAESNVSLEPAGMVVMALSILIVCGLTVFCIVRILGERSPSEHHHVPLDIDTHDAEP